MPWCDLLGEVLAPRDPEEQVQYYHPECTLPAPYIPGARGPAAVKSPLESNVLNNRCQGLSQTQPVTAEACKGFQTNSSEQLCGTARNRAQNPASPCRWPRHGGSGAQGQFGSVQRSREMARMRGFQEGGGRPAHGKTGAYPLKSI